MNAKTTVTTTATTGAAGAVTLTAQGHGTFAVIVVVVLSVSNAVVALAPHLPDLFSQCRLGREARRALKVEKLTDEQRAMLEWYTEQRRILATARSAAGEPSASPHRSRAKRHQGSGR